MKLRLTVISSIGCVAVLLGSSHTDLVRPPASSATPAVASRQVLEGTYVEVHADARLGGTAAAEEAGQWLRTADGKAYRLTFATQPALDSRQPVRVEGTVLGNQIAVSSAAPVPTTSSTTTTGTTLSGVRSVLIMMVNWTKPDATTPAAAQKQIGVTDNNWYRSVSRNRLGLTATATPWMTLPKSDCSIATAGYWKVLAAAEKAAVAHGFNPKSYAHEMVYFPFDAKCNYGGLGGVNDRSSWVNGEMDSRVTVHELGHNLGLNHSRSAICTDGAGRQVTLSNKCTTNEYGDLFDTMGVPSAGTPEFNAIQMNHLGWLTGRFTAVTSTRTLTLTPLETGTGLLAARVRVGTDEYWVEYRRPVGVDSAMSASPGALNGVLIHHVGADGGSDLLDARPDSIKSFANAALPVGATWRAPAGMSVKVNSATAAGASLTIATK